MEYLEDLKAFIDGELPATKSESIQKAAESDPTIQRELDELKAVGGALQAMKQEYEVHGFEQTLMALSGHRAGLVPARAKRRPWYGFGVGLGLAAVAAVIYAIPQIFNRPAAGSATRLASMPFAKNKEFDVPTHRLRSMNAAKTPMLQAPASAVTATPPLNLQDQVKQDHATIQDLQKQVDRLKGKSAGSFSGRSSDTAGMANGMTLPAPPLMSGTIAASPTSGEGTADSYLLQHSKGLSPSKIADLESQVRKLATAAGATVEANGPPVIRSLSITIDSPKAAALKTKIQAALKGQGTVTLEDIPQKTDDARTQSTTERIVDLKLQKEKLLQDFLQEAPQVRDLDTQIRVLQDSIKPTKLPPKSRIHVGIG